MYGTTLLIEHDHWVPRWLFGGWEASSIIRFCTGCVVALAPYRSKVSAVSS